MARAHLSGERPGHTLSATALVNEVYLKILAGKAEQVVLRASAGEERARFFSLAARAMRQILIDHARTRGRAKRGGDRVRLDAVILDHAAESASEPPIDPAEIATLLDRLEIEQPEAARVVELRFFAGLTETVIAELMGVTERTVRRHWVFAKAWLHRELLRAGQVEG